MKYPEGIRGHHILFTKNTWNCQQPTRKLRQDHSLIVPMEDAPHQALHDAISTVPLLCHRSSDIVARRFRPVFNHPVENLEALMKTIEEASSGYHAGVIERELGAVVIHALELQRGYISVGWVH